MLLTKQKYSTSCGIACIAMLAGKSHHSVMRVAIDLFKWENSPRYLENHSRTNCDEIKTLLKAFNVSRQGDFIPIDLAPDKQVSFWKKLKGINLVAVRFNKETKRWHWVIVVQTKSGVKIYDPEKKKNPKVKNVVYVNFSKTEHPNFTRFGRAKYYLRIKGC